jgi:molybdopterin molybdotransferase
MGSLVEKGAMLAFEEALRIVLSSARGLGAEQVDIDQAANRVLAEDVKSDMDIPPFNKSAMDGFACRRADLALHADGGQAHELQVVETIPAGAVPTQSIGPNQCAKIMTGSVVPQGADCVVMKEFVETPAENTIRFTGQRTYDNICYKGEDVKAGQVVLSKDTLLKPHHIAILASVGRTRPLVAKRPAVGILATGSELVDPASRPEPSQIRNSNSVQLAAQAKAMGVPATDYGIAEDTEAAIDAMFKKAAEENDVVIISGGVSVGDFDLVPGILKQNNVELLFEGIAVKPGKPSVFGVSARASRVSRPVCSDAVRRLPEYALTGTLRTDPPSDRGRDARDTPATPGYCFGLPGNPMSTFVQFEVLIKPFLYKLMGHDYKCPGVRLPLAEPIEVKAAQRLVWFPVAITQAGQVKLIEYHGSAHISSLTGADGLISVDVGVARLEKGTLVQVRLI